MFACRHGEKKIEFKKHNCGTSIAYLDEHEQAVTRKWKLENVYVFAEHLDNSKQQQQQQNIQLQMYCTI